MPLSLDTSDSFNSYRLAADVAPCNGSATGTGAETEYFTGSGFGTVANAGGLICRASKLESSLGFPDGLDDDGDVDTSEVAVDELLCDPNGGEVVAVPADFGRRVLMNRP